MIFNSLQKWARTTVMILWVVTGHAALADAPQRFATVYKISGLVQATDPVKGLVRTMRQGDAVFVGEQILASGTGEAVLRTDDAGVIAVRSNASFVVDQFKAEGKPDDQLSVRILAGALRMITGWVGVVNKAGHRIVTPTATIGIRGTDHEPYVLPTALAQQLQQPAGTYNKVNRGGTYLRTGGAEVEIDAGRVGFAPAHPRTRALMTVLLPVLLEKVPGFFVPGAFDAELETLAAQDMAQALREHPLLMSVAQTPAPATPPEVAVAAAVVVSPVASDLPAAPGACNPQALAVQWLTDLDATLAARNAGKFVNFFAPQADVQARVKGPNGAVTELQFTREELVKSTFASLAQLTEFSSRRPVVVGRLAPGSQAGACERLEVQSVVIESGVRSGGAYRLESLESFTLEYQGGRWIATRALTTQN